MRTSLASVATSEGSTKVAYLTARKPPYLVQAVRKRRGPTGKVVAVRFTDPVGSREGCIYVMQPCLLDDSDLLRIAVALITLSF
jgi:hypothetical protein